MFKLKNSKDNTFSQERRANLIHTFLLHTLYINKSGQWRAEYLRKNKVFHALGKQCYFHPRTIPADACMISIGDNVCIAGNVKFIAHDVFDIMFNNNIKYRSISGGGYFGINRGRIKIGNNVCIGEGVHLMPAIEIGNDVIIAGGAVVTRDVPDGVIVGGNPAKEIGRTEDLAMRRSQMYSTEYNVKRSALEEHYWGD